MGVTVCAASGDDGSNDQVGDGRAHVDFPASSPYTLGCGGTRLLASGKSISGEAVWNDGPGSGGGGGISDMNARPARLAGRQACPPLRSTPAAISAAACPTCAATPTRTPAT